ncbi:hypothetical protein K432DRAFT_427256 [Lepidopterella palustris CBS 459.81]|uniref:Uncharacterized protein n=1 Tax=Lepidopterella palustris CBS 459.81 TaxID=1314670 RepID=A0A8E2E793_9PEZI|nr:hypothetical protein K432DRAFT_427256 [Lepidopterella palustris CBS 459.81]
MYRLLEPDCFRRLILEPVTKLQPNYRQSVPEAFIYAFSHTLKEEWILDSLRFTSGIPTTYKLNGLPTWVPEFGRHNDTAFHSVLGLGTVGLCSATGLNSRSSATIRFLRNGRVLKLCGISAYVIQTIGEAAPEQFSGSLRSVIANWKAITNLSTGQNTQNFWRTNFLDLASRDFEVEDYENNSLTKARRLAGSPRATPFPSREPRRTK